MYDDPNIPLGDEGRRRRDRRDQYRQRRQAEQAENQRRQEQQAQERATARAETTRQRTQERLNHIDEKTASQLKLLYKAGAKKQKVEWKLRHLEDRSPEFIELGPRQTILFIVVLLGLPAVVVINLLLIAAPVEYIVGRNLDEDSPLVQFAIFVVPILLLIVEIVISVQLRRAMDEGEDTRPWRIAGWAFIIITPALILATAIAQGDLASPENWPAMIALIALAGVTDASIVFGGEIVDEALAYFYFQCRRGLLQIQLLQAISLLWVAARKVVTTFNPYLQILDRYNNQHQEQPIAAGPFSEWFRLGVNTAYGYQIIPNPNYPPLPADNPIPDSPFTLRSPLPPARDNFSQTQENTAPPAPQPVSAETTPIPDAEAEPDNDGDAAEEEYRRNLQAEQVRRAEESIEP
ncbi:hypothetical protein [Kamptonema sp. UHCC 0994]|uniref:hypothetical protein n=1 Tax=Kamptonema sp. UHCC 0994 TaxID=3031329 RepID=UPI0023B8D8FA|nr:hypothetical protein [Kamptonema sp. UHCC 0994]MDF0555619.1 hypothetical protein [Kamptonema sp. UHCC 0994]